MQDDKRESTWAGAADRMFATRMRQLRELRGLSQTGLAEFLAEYGVKVDGSAVTRMEKNASGEQGARSIRIGEAVAIAAILGESLDAMVRPTVPPDKALAHAVARRDQARHAAENAQQELDTAEKHVTDLEQFQRQIAEREGYSDGER